MKALTLSRNDTGKSKNALPFLYNLPLLVSKCKYLYSFLRFFGLYFPYIRKKQQYNVTAYILIFIFLPFFMLPESKKKHGCAVLFLLFLF